MKMENEMPLPKPPKNHICPHNDWVGCDHMTCNKCGWDPTVAAKRKKKNRELYGHLVYDGR